MMHDDNGVARQIKPELNHPERLAGAFPVYTHPSDSARELDAARDRGEARTAEGVGCGAVTGECVNCGCELPTGCGGQFAHEDACPGYKIVSKSSPPAGMATVPDGAALIAAERKRQSKRGFSAADDDGYGSNELARAAAAYLVHFIGYGDAAREWWPWESRSFKEVADPIRDLERAGALIAAEIDRIQRLAAAPQPESQR